MKDFLLNELVIFLRAFVEIAYALVAVSIYFFFGFDGFLAFILGSLVYHWFTFRKQFYKD